MMGEPKGEGSGGRRRWVGVLSPVRSGEVEESFLRQIQKHFKVLIKENLN